MADTLLLNRDGWDLCIDAEGDIAVASDPYSMTQDVASICRLFLGELWYDTTRGISYFQQILGQPVSLTYIKSALQNAALTVPGVLGATAYIEALGERSIRGQIQIVTAHGSAVVTL